MKISLVLSALIGVVSVVLFSWQSERVHQEKQRKSSLVKEALALGLPIEEHSATKSIAGINNEKIAGKKESEWKPLFDRLLVLLPDVQGTEEEMAATEQEFFEWIFTIAQLDEASLLALLEEIQSAPAPYESFLSKEELLQGVLMGVLQERPEVGMPLLNSKFADVLQEEEGLLDDLLRMAMDAWGESDADAAEKWLAENQTSFSKEIGLELGDQLLLSRIKEDPLSAQEHFSNLKNEDLKRLQWSMAFYGAEKLSDPSSLLNLIQIGKLEMASEENSPEKGELLDGINKAALRALADQLASWSSKEPVKILEDPRLSLADRQAVLGYFQEFGEINHPEVWLRYASENAEPENRERLVGRMVSNWTKNDFRATAEWIGRQPEGELRELATYSFAKAVAPHEPDSAAEWAATLPVGPERTELLVKIHHDWQKVDAESAAVFAREQGLAPAD